MVNNYELLEVAEQNIVICRGGGGGGTDQLFAYVKGRSKYFIGEPRSDHDNRHLKIDVPNVKLLAKFLISQLYYNSFYTSFEIC